MTLLREHGFDFSLLIPTESEDALRRFVDSFEAKSLARLNELLTSDYRVYSPWMSMEGAEQRLRHLFTHETAPGDLVVDQNFLKSLAEIVENRDRRALTSFGPSIEDITIAKSVDHKHAHLFSQAKDLLFDVLPDLKKIFNLVVRFIVPLSIEKPETSTMAGFSSLLCPGVIFLSLPVESRRYWRVELALELSHEIAHNIIGLYQRADELIQNGVKKSAYSGILDKNRPSIMALHGCAALAYICIVSAAFSCNPTLSQDERDYALDELNMATPKLLATVQSLKKECTFTHLGEILISNLSDAAVFAQNMKSALN